ncbi:MAG: acyltransferase family protein [Herbiconiux sp.]|nr:acyltransferase family protein [Herbiconiux sp.]
MPKKKALRPDIQGLRMIAVVAVILDHLVAWPTGGFAGVDVFFVISGFLITGILLKEHEKTGRISFVGFYRRRLKRIVPAATATLVLTIVAAFILFSSPKFVQTAWDAFYAFFFTANWHFALAGTDYFQAGDAPSPLQHFWSLSVEEQFYFVWPWLMVGVLALAGLHAKTNRRRTVTGIVMVLIVAASFAWALYDTVADPTVAYFSTFTRAWELGFGALLAISTPWWSRIPDLIRPVLGWLGLLGILASYFVINDTLPFPAPWAALPVLATGLVIVGGTGGPQRFLWPLTNPVSVYIGNISYSLYLWHFPIIIFAGVVIGGNPWLFFPITIVLIAAFAVGSYLLIEEPIMRSPWLEPARRSEKSRTWASWRQRFGPRLKFGWLGALAVACSCLVVLGLTMNERVQPSTSFAVPIAGDQLGVDAEVPVVETATSLESKAIEEAALAQEFPELVPSAAELSLATWSDTLRSTGCVEVSASNVDSCVFGPADSTKDVVVFGDSFAMAWMPGLRAGLEANGWRVHQLTRGECPSIDVEVTHGDGSPYPECASWRAWALGTIDAIRPELTVLASADSTIERLASKARGDALQSEIRSGTEAVLSRVTPVSARTVVLGAPVRGVPLRSCAVAGALPSACATKADFPWTALDRAQQSAASQAGVEYVATKRWFCTARDTCPAFAGNTPIRVDGAHLTVEFSTLLGPVLREALDPDPPLDGTDPPTSATG